MNALFFVIVILYGLMMVLLAYGFRRNLLNNPAGLSLQDTCWPKVSVIVAARNEAVNLPGLLRALMTQTAESASFEVIIVDDGSTDQTAAVVGSFQSNYTLILLTLNAQTEATGKKAALKTGISAARNEVVLITDADCLVGDGWIASYQEMFTKKNCTMVAGIVVLDKIASLGNGMEALDFYGLIAASAGASGLNRPFLCNGANMAFLKVSFLEVNGYSDHEHLSSGDDVFLLHRFIQVFGAKTIRWNLHPESWVKIMPNRDLPGFIRQRLRWASKSKSYSNSTALLVAFLVLLGNATVVISLFLAFFSGDYRLFGILFLIKFVLELPLMGAFIHYVRQKTLALWLLPSALLYPFYTTILGVISLIWKPRWKGRKIR